ncbi:integral membrane protein [Paracoccidioides lutzii Pb01]|uniref:Integral membrane protein n=1 Tax=Paracoccidioides lutzii (strain ATCC MYA-826 / Pb01) TaxID=502779 RepID=C1H030_PARBA|nr:integral membrane protein [Paracoccidioides lutzii Pb01]EEH33071.2 integral membrane protein [Paracoccidioides lutzii Pb01]
MDNRGPPPPDGDVNKGIMLNAITWSECGLALVLVLARIFTKTRLMNRWGWDDAFMCLAMVCALINTIFVTVCVYYGTGRHVYYLDEHQKFQANKFNWISQGFHVMSTNWGKVSVALFLLRIIDRAKQTRYIFFTGMVMLTLVNSVCVFTIYGQCTPTSALWKGIGPGNPGKCWHPHVQRDYAFFQGSFSAASDLVLALYPVFIIWSLQMTRKLKVGLTCVLALGVIATAAAVVKTIFLAELAAREDYTFETINLTTWISTEQYLIIIAACIPTLGPLFTAASGRKPIGKSGGYTPGYKPSSFNRRYVHHGSNGRGANGAGYRKRRGDDLLTYTMDELTTTTDLWTRSSPNGRKSDGESEEAIIKPHDDETMDGDRSRGISRRGDGGGQQQNADGIIKTMEVHVKSDRPRDMKRDAPHAISRENKGFSPWEPRGSA